MKKNFAIIRIDVIPTWPHGGKSILVELHEIPKAVVINSKTIDTRLNIGEGGGSYISTFCK